MPKVSFTQTVTAEYQSYTFSFEDEIQKGESPEDAFKRVCKTVHLAIDTRANENKRFNTIRSLSNEKIAHAKLVLEKSK